MKNFLKVFRNPQFPTGRAVRVPSYAPTEAMPLVPYYMQGKIAGIQQSGQFQPFTNVKQRANAYQSVTQIGTGIQTGQMFTQPLTDFTDTEGG